MCIWKLLQWKEKKIKKKRIEEKKKRKDKDIQNWKKNILGIEIIKNEGEKEKKIRQSITEEEEETFPKNRTVVSINIFLNIFFYIFSVVSIFFFLIGHFLSTFAFWLVMYFWKKKSFQTLWRLEDDNCLNLRRHFWIFPRLISWGFFFIWLGEIVGSSNWWRRKSITNRCSCMVCFVCCYVHFNL